MKAENSRRSALKKIVAGKIALGTSGALQSFSNNRLSSSAPLKGNINHAVCRWCFSGLNLDTLCKEAKNIGIKGIDLVGPEDWPTLKKYGLASSMCNGAEINLVDGWNDTKFHDILIKNYTEMIPKVAHYHTAGVPGRNEIEEDQELNYPAIIRAIYDTGFKGYVAQEFIPKKKDIIQSLKTAVHICDI